MKIIYLSFLLFLHFLKQSTSLTSEHIEKVRLYKQMLEDPDTTVLSTAFKHKREPADQVIGVLLTYDLDEVVLSNAEQAGIVVFVPSDQTV